jgi:hypothetical protein
VQQCIDRYLTRYLLVDRAPRVQVAVEAGKAATRHDHSHPVPHKKNIARGPQIDLEAIHLTGIKQFWMLE